MLRLFGEAESVKLGLVEVGHAFTRLAAFTVPIPVVKSQPVVETYAGWYAVFDVEVTPFVPEGS
jgi:hypothetical protein